MTEEFETDTTGPDLDEGTNGNVADDAEVNDTAFRDASVPDNFADYTFTATEHIPADDVMVSAFREFAHKEQIPQGMFNKLIGFVSDFTADARRTAAAVSGQSKAARLAALKKNPAFTDKFHSDHKAALKENLAISGIE